jgi:hypothetical protein
LLGGGSGTAQHTAEVALKEALDANGSHTARTREVGAGFGASWYHPFGFKPTY